MLNLKRWLHHQRRQIAVIGSLAFATAVCVALLAVRAVYARSEAHFGLLWNLFLAWLPMLCALAAYNLGRRRQRGFWLLIAPCLAFWLLFFPNAPYILTDILHLQPQAGVPLWYDLILLVTFAWTGAFLGLVSLYLMQSLVRRAAGTWISWVFTLVVLGLTGFGVYLGRFPRWNSWDVLTHPLSLLLDIGTRLRHPLAHSRTFVFSALFSLCLAAMYFMLTAIIQLQPEEAPYTGEGANETNANRLYRKQERVSPLRCTQGKL
ncbi:MAG: DUF1361 domain-containing protein [Chloroflexi bacterium]|nr:DUF1361 domain-containing protein [Chloroflexota bacterium]